MNFVYTNNGLCWSDKMSYLLHTIMLLLQIILLLCYNKIGSLSKMERSIHLETFLLVPTSRLFIKIKWLSSIPHLYMVFSPFGLQLLLKCHLLSHISSNLNQEHTLIPSYAQSNFPELDISPLFWGPPHPQQQNYRHDFLPRPSSYQSPFYFPFFSSTFSVLQTPPLTISCIYIW